MMDTADFIWGCIGAGSIWFIIGTCLYGFYRGITGKGEQ